MDKNKQKLSNDYAVGILPSLNFADNTQNFGAISDLVRWLRASESRINYSVTPGTGDTYDTCGVIKTGSYNGFDLSRDPLNCNMTFGAPTWCSREFPISRFGFEKCDICADYNDYITRKSSDLTGGPFRAGNSITDTMMEMMATGYNFTLNKAVIVGDPLVTNTVVPGISSLESVYVAANGVNVVSGAGLPVWKALEIAMNQKAQRGFSSTGASEWLMHPMTELRMREEARTFYTDLTTSFDPLAGVRIITDIQVPVVAGVSKIYELQDGNVGLHMRFPTAKTQTFDEDKCGKKCYTMYNYASVFAINPCALTVIENVQVEASKFGNVNPVNPQVFC